LEQGKSRQQLPSDQICFNFLKGVPERYHCHRAHLSYFQIYNSLPRIVKVRCFWLHSPSCLQDTHSLCAILRLGRSPRLHSPYCTRIRRRPRLLLCTCLTDRQWSDYPFPGETANHSTMLGLSNLSFLMDRAPWASHRTQRALMIPLTLITIRKEYIHMKDQSYECHGHRTNLKDFPINTSQTA